jgi:hypothetical protein
MLGNPLMNDAQLSQTAGRTKTRQPGLMVKPTYIVLSSCKFIYACSVMQSRWFGALSATA